MFLPLRRVLASPRFSGLAARAYNSSSRSPSDGSNSARAPPPRLLNDTTQRSSSNNSTNNNNNSSNSRDSDTPPSRLQVPFVPSTCYMKPSELALSTFFALHRPINIPPAAPAPGAEPPTEPEAWEHGLPYAAPPPPVPSPLFILISVRRQRRLKMKKHKYKKLMKRTRNLRRRIERQKN